MDIHKPKPWHDVRELAKEVGTIVVGVLIALGGEQGVEWLHWRHVVAETRTAIREEIAVNTWQEGLLVQDWPCERRRLDTLAARLGSGQQSWPGQNASRTDGLPRAISLPYFPWTDAAWRSAESNGALAHMPNADRRQLAWFYTAIDAQRDWMVRQAAPDNDLSVLAADQQLSDAARDRAVAAIQGVRFYSFMLQLSASQFLDRLKPLGIDPDRPPASDCSSSAEDPLASKRPLTPRS